MKFSINTDIKFRVNTVNMSEHQIQYKQWWHFRWTNYSDENYSRYLHAHKRAEHLNSISKKMKTK